MTIYIHLLCCVVVDMQVKPELRKLIEAMPLNEGATGNAAGKIDVNALLPTDRTYFTYEGSLTAPPCT